MIEKEIGKGKKERVRVRRVVRNRELEKEGIERKGGRREE